MLYSDSWMRAMGCGLSSVSTSHSLSDAYVINDEYTPETVKENQTQAGSSSSEESPAYPPGELLRMSNSKSTNHTNEF